MRLRREINAIQGIQPGRFVALNQNIIVSVFNFEMHLGVQGPLP